MASSGLIAVLIFIIPMCFTPGPNNLLCAAHGSQHGFRKTIPLTMGMAIGWTTLGIFIAAGAAHIEKYEWLVDFLTYLGAIYISYLAYNIATSTSVKDENNTELLGIGTGILLQIINGKAWIHFLILFTIPFTLFGSGFFAKFGLVIINLLCGYPAVLTWSYFGTFLRNLFNSPNKVIWLNYLLGVSLLGVAIWIVLPHQS